MASRSAKPSSRRQQREACLAEWRSWDWSKSNVELAEEMGFSSSFVGDIRRRVGAPKSLHFHKYRAKFKKPNLTKWRSWDWSKQDIELAREKGLSRERIRQIRQLLGLPKSPRHGDRPRNRRQQELALQWATENPDRLRGLSWAEVKRNYRFNRKCHVYAFLKAKGVLRNGKLIRKHRWDLMNFDLPSSVLERIWKLPFCAAGGYRCRKRLRAPKWRLFGGPAVLQRRGQFRAYHRAVRAEKRKAAKYFAERGRR